MNYENIKNKVKELFQKQNAIQRFYHMEEVVKMALFLNQQFNLKVDEEQIRISGIVHDYAKNLSMKESQKLLERHLSLAEIEELFKAPTVVHSFTAYYLISEELGIYDEDIRNSVKYHTTGRPRMSNLEKLIFVSDAVEATRTYDGVDILRKAVLEDFEKGMLLIIETTLKHLTEKGSYIHPLTIETYNYYRR